VATKIYAFSQLFSVNSQKMTTDAVKKMVGGEIKIQDGYLKT
jgi:hypothetical protein